MIDSTKPIILNVDDYQPLLYTRSRILRQAGFEVREASSGREALHLVNSVRPAVVVLDVGLPDISGIEVCRRIKADPVTAPILVLQTSASLISGQDRARALEAGADTYLIDPMEPEELIATVKALLRLGQAEAQLGQSEKLWRTVFDAANDAMLLVDNQYTIRACNQRALDLYGYAESELIGLSLRALRAEWARGVLDDQMNQALQQGGAVYETGHLRKDGSVISVEVSTKPFYSAEHPRFVDAIRDVTERKRAEQERLRLLEAERQARAIAERNAERLARLQSVTAALSGSPTPAEVAQVIVAQGTAALEAQAGILALLDLACTHLQIAESVGYPDDLIEAWRNFPLTAETGLSQAARTGAPVWVESGDERRALYPSLRDERAAFVAFASLPLVVSGRTLGAIAFSFTHSTTFDENTRKFLLALADQCAQALERARLYEIEKRARSAAEEIQDKLAFFAQASGVLAASLDYETTLKLVAQLAVPRVADWCTIDILEEDGTLRLVEIVHVDPGKVRWARELREKYPLDPNSPAGAPNVIRTGRSEFYPEIPESVLGSVAHNQEELDILHRVGYRAVMCVPLTARGRTFGAVTLVTAESGRHYTTSDLALAEELARRAAVAIDNARLYNQSQEAVRARDLFLSIASHELKTPLTIIQGYAELLQHQVQNALDAPPAPRDSADLVSISRAQLLKRVENVHAATDRLTALINELLDINRMQRGVLELNPERVDLGQLITTVIQNVSARDSSAKQPRRVNISFEASLTPIWGQWDQSRLEQVLVNLVDNAVKYSPLGGHVEVSANVQPAPEDATGRQVHLIVRDHGIGIPAAEQDRIFHPFARATNATKQHFPGLGLGLAITKEIIERHNGRIWAESSGENQGTAIHILLPLFTPSPERGRGRGIGLKNMTRPED